MAFLEASDVVVFPDKMLLSWYETRPFVHQNAAHKSSHAHGYHRATALNL